MDSGTQQDIHIIDKDESSDQGFHVVGGFVIEDSTTPYANGRLSFVPEDYGKPAAPTATPTSTAAGSSTTPTAHKKQKAPAQQAQQPSDLPEGMYRCEFCGHVDDKAKFLPPSRRFCSLTCCKRYSAEKRYYPYGKDEEGIAQSIREGLLNPNRSSAKSGRGSKQVREERRRRLAFYNKSPSQDPGPSGDTVTRRPRGRGGRRGRRGRRPASPSPSQPHITRSGQGSLSTSIMEVYTHPYGTPIYEWTMEDVGDFLTALGYEAYIDKFTEHEIDGRALSLVRDHHLLMTMKLRLGPTLKICEQVQAIKANEEIFEE